MTAEETIARLEDLEYECNTLRRRLRNCHRLLQGAFAWLDPEVNVELADAIRLELEDCDEGTGPCVVGSEESQI